MLSMEALFTRKSYVQYSDEQLRAMRDSYVGGKNIYQISLEYGIDAQAVRRRLLAMGADMRTRGKKPALSDKQCIELYRLRENGLTLTAAAERYGVTTKTICNTMHRARYLVELAKVDEATIDA